MIVLHAALKKVQNKSIGSSQGASSNVPLEMKMVILKDKNHNPKEENNRGRKINQQILREIRDKLIKSRQYTRMNETYQTSS